MPYWAAGVIADPDQLAAMQNAFSGPGMELGWEFPLAVGGLTADQAQGLYNALNRADHGDARADRAAGSQPRTR